MSEPILSPLELAAPIGCREPVEIHLAATMLFRALPLVSELLPALRGAEGRKMR
ncbi:MAG: hypothetical protein WA755_18440 [Candidatus Acidiferrales bacterium]